MRWRGNGGAKASLVAAGLALGCGGRSHGSWGGPDNGLAGPVELRLVDQIGEPIAGTKALVDDTVVVTDADGRATVDGVGATYDFAVVVGDTAFVFLGMAGRTPTIAVALLWPLAANATVRVTRPDGLRNNERVFLVADATNGPPDGRTVYADQAVLDDATVIFDWTGSTNVDVTAEALIAELDADEQRVVGYSAYARTTQQLVPSEWTYWEPDFSSVPFDTGTIHVDTDADTYAVVEYDVSVSEASGAVGTTAFAAGAGEVDLTVLDIPSARYRVRASFQENWGTFMAEQADVALGASVHLQSGDAPKSLTPNVFSTVDRDTQFSWTASAGSINQLSINTTDLELPRLEYEIATAAHAVTLPDLSALGIEFPAGRPLLWWVKSELGHASMDTYASGEHTNRYGFSVARAATATSP